MSILEKTQTKIKKNAEEEIKKEKEAKELAEKMKPVNITTQRYRTKIGDVRNKSVTFSAIDPNTFNAIDNFTRLKTKEQMDYKELTNKI